MNMNERNEQIKAVLSDEAFVQTLLDAENEEAVQKMLADKGVEMSLTEIELMGEMICAMADGTITEEQLEKLTKGGELSEDDLEAAAGGGITKVEKYLGTIENVDYYYKTPVGSSISKAAITVTPGNSLTIYGQANGSGRIEATATSISAGIGGGWSQDCGSVTINGGTVVAKSTSGGPGIGGGYQKAGGTVTINGGTVIATGASSTYPGIGGGGSSYEQGKLYVGANVVVKAGSSSTLTDANIQPHVDGQIDLTTCYQYYSAETVGPAPLVQINSAFSAYIGEAFELSPRSR